MFSVKLSKFVIQRDCVSRAIFSHPRCGIAFGGELFTGLGLLNGDDGRKGYSAMPSGYWTSNVDGLRTLTGEDCVDDEMDFTAEDIEVLAVVA